MKTDFVRTIQLYNNTRAAIVILMLFLVAASQAQTVKVTCHPNSRNGYDFFYEKESVGSYVVFVKLSSPVNISNDEVKIEISDNKGMLFSTRPIEFSKRMYFSSYASQSMRGVLRPKKDISFVYALPIRAGTYSHVYKLNNLSEKYFNAPGNTPFYSYLFRSKKRAMCVQFARV